MKVVQIMMIADIHSNLRFLFAYAALAIFAVFVFKVTSEPSLVVPFSVGLGLACRSFLRLLRAVHALQPRILALEHFRLHLQRHHGSLTEFRAATTTSLKRSLGFLAFYCTGAVVVGYSIVDGSPSSTILSAKVGFLVLHAGMIYVTVVGFTSHCADLCTGFAHARSFIQAYQRDRNKSRNPAEAALSSRTSETESASSTPNTDSSWFRAAADMGAHVSDVDTPHGFVSEVSLVDIPAVEIDSTSDGDVDEANYAIPHNDASCPESVGIETSGGVREAAP